METAASGTDGVGAMPALIARACIMEAEWMVPIVRLWPPDGI